MRGGEMDVLRVSEVKSAQHRVQKGEPSHETGLERARE